MATVGVTSQTVLAPGPGAPRAARKFADGVLGHWGLVGMAASVELVVSELVANAVRYAGTTVTVRLTCLAEGLLVEVDDVGPGVARVITATQPTVGGYGLVIVERLAEDWGQQARDRGEGERDGSGPDRGPGSDHGGSPGRGTGTSTSTGKTVWARLRLPDDLPPGVADRANI